MSGPRWVTAFLDVAADDHAATSAFWSAVTGYEVSPPRGEHGEFATLVPPDGDDFLRIQRLGSGPSRLHLDVHADDHEFAVHTSPGGLTWCTVSHPASVRPRPARWPGGHSSLVDQVCLDIPADSYDEECAYWAGLLGLPLRETRLPEFRVLERPAGQPLRVLLQRLGESDGPVRAHLDLASTDRAAETERHVALGARILAEHVWWTVLADPAGSPYCVIDRDPATGDLDLTASGSRPVGAQG